MLVLAKKELILVGYQALFLKEIIVCVLDVSVVAVSAMFDGDIGTILGNAKQPRQQGDDCIVIRVDRQCFEGWSS